MLNPGTLLQSRYQILHTLASGGMGAVYLAQDLRLARTVVVKENIGGDPRQFQHEALLLASLNHTNLPRVTDHFVEANGAQYLVMDFVEGEDLDMLVQRTGAVPELQALNWLSQILDAVTYLHHRGVIHRDIKPANIKITPSGQAVLVDFGIAKRYQPGQPTLVGARMGTTGYAAPEQYSGGTDQRSDVYSLGATLYTLLTARAPTDALALANGSAVLVPPRALNPGVTVPIEQVILRAMSPQPNQRFQSTTDMKTALLPPQVAATTMLPSMKVDPSNVLQLVSLGIAVLALVLVAWLVWWANSTNPTIVRLAIALNTATPTLIPTATPITPTTIPISTPLPLTPKGKIAYYSQRNIGCCGGSYIYEANADGSSTQRLVSVCCQTAPIWSMNGDAIVYATAGSDQAIYIFDGNGERKIVTGVSDVTNLSWSPDGKSILFESRQPNSNNIFVANVAKLNDRHEMPKNSCDNSDPVWSPDGGSIVYSAGCGTEQGIFVMTADGSSQTRLTNTSAPYSFPAWSPDGHSIIFVSTRDGNEEIYTMSSDGSDMRRLTNNPDDDYAPTWSPDGKYIAFVSTRDGNPQIYIMNADGSNPRNLTHNPSKNYAPVWSPDSQFIAFVSGRDGNDEIYVMSLDGMYLQRLTANSGPDNSPAWSPK